MTTFRVRLPYYAVVAAVVFQPIFWCVDLWWKKQTDLYRYMCYNYNCFKCLPVDFLSSYNTGCRLYCSVPGCGVGCNWHWWQHGSIYILWHKLDKITENIWNQLYVNLLAIWFDKLIMRQLENLWIDYILFLYTVVQGVMVLSISGTASVKVRKPQNYASLMSGFYVAEDLLDILEKRIL